jgi:RNA polymerase sigma-70 factor, ECF subfamily
VDSDHGRSSLDDSALQCIRYRARRLMQQADFAPYDGEDLEQELTTHLLAQLPKYDAARGAFSTFVDRVIAHKAADMLYARSAQCRDPRLRISSLEGTFRMHEGMVVPLLDLELEDAMKVQRGLSERSALEEAELRADLARALAALTPEQVDLCRQLLTSTITEISNATGVPRPTLYDRVARIRAAFARAGLGEYVGRLDRAARASAGDPREEQLRPEDQA